jgi:hypothetical protein
MLKPAILLIVYAAVLFGLGVLVYRIAPPDSNAATALLIPSVCGILSLVAAVLCIIGRGTNQQGKPKKAGMIGVHAGIVLPLLFTLAFVGRALPTTTSVLEAQATLAEAGTLERSAREVLGDEEFAQARETAEKGYLAMTLWGVTGVSIVTFAGLLLLRPKTSKSEG